MNEIPNREIYEFQSNIKKPENKENTLDSSLRKVFLRGNPFLYNKKHVDMKVDSVDDYYVEYRGMEKTFGEVVHSFDYSNFRKKRFVKKTLKKWKKDYITERNRVVEENLGAVELLGEIKFLRFRTWIKICLILILFSVLFISVLSTGRYIELDRSEFIYDLSLIITNGFERFPILKSINNVSIYLLLITIIYSYLYSTISNDFKKMYNLSKSILKKAYEHVTKDYKRKYKKVRKYYLNKIKENRVVFPGYDINLVGEGKENLEVYEEVSKETVEKARTFKNTKLIYIITKYILVILSMISSLLVIIYIIYETIKNLLF